MVTLLFRHEGWDVVTAAWSASAKPGKNVQICYQWGANGISFFDSATGIRRLEIPIEMRVFLDALSGGGGVIDLRQYQN